MLYVNVNKNVPCDRACCFGGRHLGQEKNTDNQKTLTYKFFYLTAHNLRILLQMMPQKWDSRCRQIMAMNSTSHITCFKDILKGHYRRHLKMTVGTSTASTNPLSYLWDSLSKPDLCQQSFANAFRSRRDPYNLPPQCCIYFRVLNVRRILFYVFFSTSFDHPIPSTRIKYT